MASDVASIRLLVLTVSAVAYTAVVATGQQFVDDALSWSSSS
jgi:hypothetical protein